MDCFNPDKIKPHKIYDKIKGRVLVFIGRLVPTKDPITLLKAFRIVKKYYNDVKLIICGDGELKKYCERLSDNDVHFLGYVKEIPSILKGADIYVHPSIYDPSPRALLEAMAMGKACVATIGTKDYLLGCGILVKPKNPEMLARAIIYLLKNRKLMKELGKKARERILEYHDYEKNIEFLMEILERFYERN